jgi:hypothetical protein
MRHCSILSLTNDLFDRQARVILAVARAATIALLVAILEDDDLFAARLADDFGANTGIGDHRRSDLEIVTTNHEHFVKDNFGAGLDIHLGDVEELTFLNAVL